MKKIKTAFSILCGVFIFVQGSPAQATELECELMIGNRSNSALQFSAHVVDSMTLDQIELKSSGTRAPKVFNVPTSSIATQAHGSQFKFTLGTVGWTDALTLNLYTLGGLNPKNLKSLIFELDSEGAPLIVSQCVAK